MIEEDCLQHGIGMAHSLRLDAPSATFLCVLDEERDLLAGVSDMEIMAQLTPAFLEQKARAAQWRGRRRARRKPAARIARLFDGALCARRCTMSR